MRRPSDRSVSVPLDHKSSVIPGPLDAEMDVKGFQLSAWQMRVHSNPINTLLQPAKKAVSTKDWLVKQTEIEGSCERRERKEAIHSPTHLLILDGSR